MRIAKPPFVIEPPKYEYTEVAGIMPIIVAKK